MRRNFFLLTIAAALLTLSSCKKVWDYVKDHPNETATNCKIEKIAYEFQSPWGPVIYKDTAVFKYNKHGDPISVTFALKWLQNDRYFEYDAKNRLIAYYNGGESHKYGYKGNIIVDTFYSTGSTTVVVDHEPDELGRIIKSSFTILGDTTNRIPYHKFAYDNKGNRIVPFAEYTNKTNILQTNKVWMFIKLNYSVNQAKLGNMEFNKQGLPYKLSLPDNSDFFLFNGNYPSMIISYDCK